MARGRYCATATVSSENVLDAASFPLVPYVNRIRGGRFTFRGREVRLAPNMAGDPSPLHGQGWLNPWAVAEADERRAVLGFRHDPGEWPWAYEARQEFALDERGLSIGLTCRNTSDEPMPCGLGQHPYFPCGPETELDTQVTHAWTVDEQVLPVDRVVADGRYDLRERLVCGQGLDNGFDGWTGEARMSDPELAVRPQSVVAPGALLPALFAGRRRDFRRRAGDPRQCRAQRPGGGVGRARACACSSRARRCASTCGSR